QSNFAGFTTPASAETASRYEEGMESIPPTFELVAVAKGLASENPATPPPAVSVEAAPPAAPRDDDSVREEEVGLVGVIAESRTDVGSINPPLKKQFPAPVSPKNARFFTINSRSKTPFP
ncbi:hypothetical protein M569_00299, partial [Genlisea aurea]